ncbi:orexin receptor type 2 [Caerostris darwini]|uniref:Orexin receptor type 2 n=1 Tax=Caerostris darwini TaxID=1538125 RepID=A0AAV4T6S4_9ARAC|nr:orexin receptor type 2 [Caerostris darwini]
MDNGTANCNNEYCVSDEDYLAMIHEYIIPTPLEWMLISLHVVVFVVGLVGNALVCVSVYRNHTMRTVTNYFIVNLALADFLVILVCLPPTVLCDVTETWFFGRITCKLVLYLQVSASI